MENIQKHIDHDKKVLDDPLSSSQARRHVEEELEALEAYHARHPEDDHDPTPLELYCDANPDAPECRIFED
ncbi:MAG: CP12 domain-containing protein [Candidatus Nanopelagicales bacterium]|nr:CP12 carbon metabolic regulator [Synechococcus phage DSL-LC03]